MLNSYWPLGVASFNHLFSAVPQAAEFFDSQPLAKGKTEKTRNKKKAKNIESPDQASNSGFITLASPQSDHTSASLRTSTEPVARPGFSRVSTAVETEDGVPMSGAEERTKVAFGFSAGKRRAASSLEEERAQKRR
jgi:U4/U6.U5 tri-snRNP-associated protein 1